MSSPEEIVVPTDFLHQNIQAFLEWNPPRLEVAEASHSIPPGSSITSTSMTHDPPITAPSMIISETITPKPSAGFSKGSRPPAFYDLHLAIHLRLNHLRPFPKLVASMIGTVDRLIQTRFADGCQLPTDPGRVPSRKTLVEEAQASSTAFFDENGVVEYYRDHVAASALPIASTLLLHPSSATWHRRIIWTKAPKPEVGGHALADGFLRFTDPGENRNREAYLGIFESKIRAVFSQLSARTLGTWEVKSLTVGDEEVMNEIYQKALRREKFDWKVCDGACNRKGHDKLHLTEAQAPRGLDPLQPPWKLPSDDELPIGPSLRRSQRLLKHGTPEAPIFREASPGSDAVDSPASSPSKLRARDSDSPIKRDVSKDADPDYPDSRNERRYVTSHSFLQQAWAQSVRNDCTIIVLHSGNHEIIGVRHRASQTLYVSEVIEPHKSNLAYGKIQVGIYIAAIQETMDRIGQEENGALPHAPHWQQHNEGGEDGNEKDYDKGEDGHVNKRARMDGSQSSKGPDNGGSTHAYTFQGKKKAVSGNVYQAISNAASSRNVAYIHLFYGIYASPAPAVFIRKESVLQLMSPPSSPKQGGNGDQAKRDQYADSIDIILTSEKPPGSTGIVHLGRMNVEPNGMDIPVAVKLGFASFEKNTLKQELRIYMHLQSKRVKGIPRCFGIFAYDGTIEGSEGPHALIMSFAGASLHGQAGNASSTAKKSLLSTLKAIHRAGVVHGDIRLANLCVNQDGQAFIVDFSHSEMSSSRARMNREIAELCRLLKIQDANEVPPMSTVQAGLRRSVRIKEAGVEQRRAAAHPSTSSFPSSSFCPA